MAELTCPLCKLPVRVPKAEINTEYLCKKCHTPFHLNEAKQAVVGQPPDIEKQVQLMKEKLRQKVKQVPVRRIVTGLSALILALVAYRLLFASAEPLQRVAQEAAQAIADNDPGTLEGIAYSGTSEDVDRWFKEVAPRLVEARQKWNTKEEVVEVHVGLEDTAQKKGHTVVSIHPGVPTGGLDVSLANPAAATAAAQSPFEVEMNWTLNRWGHWKFDGRETYAKAHPTP